MEEFKRDFPNEMRWIILKNADDLQMCRAKYGAEDNIGFLIEDPDQDEPLQVGDVILSCKNKR
jgi:hypothetical protein